MDGQRVFYREAGPADAPVLLLLHGYPTSSSMFRHLIPALADRGAPIGWRLALRRPAAVTAIISQNGNAYDDGFVPGSWAGPWAYASDPGPETEAPIREVFGLDAARWQYVTGVAEPDLTFGRDGATAFARDLPDAEIHLIDGGHFLLESALDTVVGYLRGFLGRTTAAA
ncbi:alpha/beta fold hydrolase [Pseudonocardia sp. GCM10023141]|uniref:alpha/beta fold hydrolase n=1 Tax=Pseudonocardia sp. GCM10023141 TaxID=3252653 RepID=UPI003611BE3C